MTIAGKESLANWLLDAQTMNELENEKINYRSLNRQAGE